MLYAEFVMAGRRVWSHYLKQKYKRFWFVAVFTAVKSKLEVAVDFNKNYKAFSRY